METKKKLRNTYKAARKALTNEQREDYSIAIANQALKLDIWHYEYYHVFLPIARHHEINTEYLLHILQGKDKNILLPKAHFETKKMEHYLLTDSTKIATNEYGIPEPQNGIKLPITQAQVIFIPLLAYDKKGNRIGYGGGFYDRALAHANPELVKIGLSFFEPENHIDTSQNDIPLDMCITPNGNITF